MVGAFGQAATLIPSANRALAKRLGLDRVAQCLLEAACSLTCGVIRLSIKVLGSAGSLIGYALSLPAGVARDFANPS